MPGILFWTFVLLKLFSSSGMFILNKHYLWKTKEKWCLNKSSAICQRFLLILMNWGLSVLCRLRYRTYRLCVFYILLPVLCLILSSIMRLTSVSVVQSFISSILSFHSEYTGSPPGWLLTCMDPLKHLVPTCNNNDLHLCFLCFVFGLLNCQSRFLLDSG